MLWKLREPILTAFETACNIAGDNIGTYVIGKRLGMTEPEAEVEADNR